MDEMRKDLLVLNLDYLEANVKRSMDYMRYIREEMEFCLSTFERIRQTLDIKKAESAVTDSAQ